MRESLICQCKVVIQEMEMNLTLKCDFTYIRLVMIRKEYATKWGEDVGDCNFYALLVRM